MISDVLFEPLAENATAEAHRILERAIATMRPSNVFALFSGGHDSLCAAHVASTHPAFTACVHIHTGIGIPETRQFVHDTCRRYGWRLLEYSPPVTYEDLVRHFGFPGPHLHRIMYNRLKERCLEQLARDYAGHLMLISGVRKAESRRRMGNAQAFMRQGRRLWVAPLLDWSDNDKHAYMADQGLPKNPVVERLCMSGECLCDAFAAENEIQEIAHYYPEVAQRIHALEEQVAPLGKPCRWGQEPTPSQEADTDQGSLFGLCWSCENKPKSLTEVESST